MTNREWLGGILTPPDPRGLYRARTTDDQQFPVAANAGRPEFGIRKTFAAQRLDWVPPELG